MVKRYDLSFYEGISLEDNGSFVHYDDYAALKSELDALREQVRWRDVREELPDDLESVLVYFEDLGASTVCCYDESEDAFVKDTLVAEIHDDEPLSLISGNARYWLPIPTVQTGQNIKD